MVEVPEMDQKRHAVLECMDEVALFHALTREEVQILAPYLDLRRYDKGEIIFREGEPGDFICFLCSGKVEVKKETKFKGKQIILALISKGSFIGELSIIDGNPCSATAVACADSQVLLLLQSNFDSFVEKYPIIGLKLLRGIARILSLRLRQSAERLAAIL
jgi:CRP-like cAMP-binding protein